MKFARTIKNMLLTTSERSVSRKLINSNALSLFVRIGLLVHTKSTADRTKIKLTRNACKAALLKHIICFTTAHKRIVSLKTALKLLKSHPKNIYILSTPYGLKTLSEAVILKTGGILFCKIVV